MSSLGNNPDRKRSFCVNYSRIVDLTSTRSDNSKNLIELWVMDLTGRIKNSGMTQMISAAIRKRSSSLRVPPSVDEDTKNLCPLTPTREKRSSSFSTPSYASTAESSQERELVDYEPRGSQDKPEVVHSASVRINKDYNDHQRFNLHLQQPHTSYYNEFYLGTSGKNLLISLSRRQVLEEWKKEHVIDIYTL